MVSGRGTRIACGAVCSLLVLGSAARAADDVATAVRATRAPVIDGVIEQNEWHEATQFEDFVQLEPERGAPASERTVGFLLYTETHIYIAVYSYDSRPEMLTAQLNNRDDDLTQDDSVTVYLDTFHDRQTCYFFQTNPLATQTDGRIKDDGRVRDVTWDAPWEVATRVVADGWTAEFAIPLRTLQFRAGEDRTWGFNLGRTRRSTLEHSFWAGPLESAFRVSQYGAIGGLEVKGGGKRYDFIPYVQGGWEQGGDSSGNTGLDLRYTFRPETTANLTVNPDFAIIEADEEFVNLTRFPVRLEERRPFFLETNDRFRQRVQTFYSRRIEEIDFGGKLQSRNAAWEFTLLSTRSPVEQATVDGSSTNVSENAGYVVARAERQVLGSSQVSVMLANRSLAGSNEGSVGIDTNLRLTRIMSFTGQLIRSHGAFQSGNWGYFVRPSWDTSTFHWHYRYTHLGDRFGDNVNSVGFIRDDNRREMDSDLSKTFWLAQGAVQRIDLSSRNNIFWGQDRELRGYHNFLEADVEFRNRWIMSTRLKNDFKRFEKGFHNDTWQVKAGYNTREFQSWEVVYETGRNFDSDLESVGARISRKLSTALAVEYQLSRVWLDPDPEQQATVIHVVRARHNFTRDFLLRLFFQTNSVIDRRNVEVVLLWRHKPPFGSFQFAFQRGRAAFGQRSDQQNTFFVKLAHVL